jgi:hypothetical protein
MASDADDLKLRAYDRQKRLVWVLGIAGLVPLAAIAMVLVAVGKGNALAEPILNVFRIYSATIVAFLGGARWGAALFHSLETAMPGQRVTAPIWAVSAAVAATLGILMPAAYGMLLLLLAHCTLGAWDSLSASSGNLPRWTAPVRIVLTGLAVFSHILAMVAMA